MTDIVGIGNPLLDSTAEVPRDYIERHGLKHGQMSLVDEKTQAALLADLDQNTLNNHPGGSVANVLCAAHALGASTLFIGSRGDDKFGKIYEHLLSTIGVQTGLTISEQPQGQCLVLITEEGERTMATNLGAALALDEASIEEETISNAKVLHIEGYQLDGEKNTRAVFKACDVARRAGLHISIDLADPGVIDRNEDDLRRLVKEYATIIFANEEEAKRYTGLAEEQAAESIATEGSIAIVKIGSKGSIIATKEQTSLVAGFHVPVINTNGAGDAYAGAFLASMLRGDELPIAGLIASYAAGQVVAQERAQLLTDVRQAALMATKKE